VSTAGGLSGDTGVCWRDSCDSVHSHVRSPHANLWLTTVTRYLYATCFMRPPRVPPLRGERLPPRLKWDPALAADYDLALVEHPETQQHLDQCLAACAAGNPEEALAAFHLGVAAAAEAAGMPTRQRTVCPRHRNLQPWYDAECRQAARALLPGARRGGPQARAAVREHRTLLRRKERE
jgi:hypothetical protein